jgi:hypothetical protein
MKRNLAKELAQHCLDYVTPVCSQHHVDRIDVLTHLANLIRTELNIAESSDPERNR